MVRTMSINSFADVRAVGNPFLYLPRELRDKIYKHIIVDDSQIKKFKQCNDFVVNVSKKDSENFLVTPNASNSTFVVVERVFLLKQIKKILFSRLTTLYGLDVWIKKEFKKRGVDVEIGI
jgi:hypothetical protein